MTNRYPLIAAGALAIGLALTGCATDTTDDTTTPGEDVQAPELSGTRWTIDDSDTAYLEFEEGEAVKGNDGCNGFGGSYSVADDETISLTGIVSTLKGCPGMKPWLAQTRTIEVAGDDLVAYDADGEELGTLHRAE
ncbi:META domain-containing protein [Microbacterium sp. gxy059]|uniref:META domain-containing protein n=1 Tax=Microbacterium sp. gxy059 TaxID=2957199 RepID=UPI003D99A517